MSADRSASPGRSAARPHAELATAQLDGAEVPVAELRSVDFGYTEDQQIVRQVSFRVCSGEVLTLLGPSGCGKSTCLNMVAGLLKPWRGQVLFKDEPLTGLNTAVGYMTQDDTLLPWRTVKSNIALALRLAGVPKRDWGHRIEDVLDLIDLQDAQSKYPAQLSGGMKRRALLARSLVTRPPLLLLDEPFAAIDADLREKLQAELRAMAQELRQTVLFVTHDVSEAALISDRVIVMGTSKQKSTQVRATIDIPFPKKRSLEELRLAGAYLEVEQLLRLELTSDRASEDS